ncbi:sialate O-acetylesterase [Agrobacterium tumefaciens]|uniref:sialate O-acetylesterase n=1 Tax=Agrobacterium tumefaciens TaxID=358 RepID=UPI001572D317|nr:sialate O-acetylesterase [Agrobacterium tumefaciens]
MPIVKSTNGYGLPVSFVDQGGLPVEEAANGFGTPVVEVATGGLPVTRVGQAADIMTDVILMVKGQSNQVNGSGAVPDAALDRFPDNAVVLSAGATAVSAPVQPPTATQFGVGNSWGGNPSPGIQIARLLSPRIAPGKKIVVLPLAVPATGLCAGTVNPYWDPSKTGGGNAGISYQDALNRLTIALSLYPGAKVISSWLQGENDAAISKAIYKATFTALVNGVRSIPGAEQTEFIIHRMLITAGSPAGKRNIDLAHRELALDLSRVIFAGAVTGDDDSGVGGVGVHFTAAGQRKAGAKGAQLQPYIASLYAAAPAMPINFQVGGENYSFVIPATHAAGFDLEIQDADLGGAWTVYELLPSEGQMPGDTITGRVPGIRNVNVRVRAKSRGASGLQYSAYTPTLQCLSGGWWHRQVVAAIDYTNNRAYVNGTAYATIAAAVSAGALTATASGHSAAITVPSAFTLLSSGVTAATLITGGASQTLAMVDDGSSNNSVRARWWDIGGAAYIGAHMASAGTPIGSNTAMMETGANAAASKAVKIAARLQANNHGACINGGAVKTVASATVPAGMNAIRTGSVADGVSGAWTGAKGLIELTSVIFSDDELLRETA